MPYHILHVRPSATSSVYMRARERGIDVLMFEVPRYTRDAGAPIVVDTVNLFPGYLFVSVNSSVLLEDYPDALGFIKVGERRHIVDDGTVDAIHEWSQQRVSSKNHLLSVNELFKSGVPATVFPVEAAIRLGMPLCEAIAYRNVHGTTFGVRVNKFRGTATQL